MAEAVANAVPLGTYAANTYPLAETAVDDAIIALGVDIYRNMSSGTQQNYWASATCLVGWSIDLFLNGEWIPNFVATEGIPGGIKLGRGGVEVPKESPRFTIPAGVGRKLRGTFFCTESIRTKVDLVIVT